MEPRLEEEARERVEQELRVARRTQRREFHTIWHLKTESLHFKLLPIGVELLWPLRRSRVPEYLVGMLANAGDPCHDRLGVLHRHRRQEGV